MLDAGVPFDSAEDLFPWAATVLRRLHLDELRRARRRDVPFDDAPQLHGAAPGDVGSAVEARVAFERAALVIGSWSQEERGILFGAGVDTAMSAGAFYVRRHRLRAKLREAMTGLAAAVTGAWQRVLPSAAGTVAAVSLAAPAVLLGSNDAVVDGLDVRHPARAAAAAWDLPSRPPAVGGLPPAPGGGASPGTGRRGGPGSLVTAKPRARAEMPVGPARPYAQVEDTGLDEPLACVWATQLVPRRCIDDPGMPWPG